MTKISFELPSTRDQIVLDANIKNNSNDIIELINNDVEFQQGVDTHNESGSNIYYVGIQFINNLTLLVESETELSEIDKQDMINNGLDPENTDVRFEVNIVAEGVMISAFDYNNEEVESQIDKESSKIIEFIDIEMYENNSGLNLDETQYEDDIEQMKTYLRDYITDQKNYEIRSTVEINQD